MKNSLFLFLLLVWPLFSWGDCTLSITVDGPITAATHDYFARAEKEALRRNCGSILVRMNTPGGELGATRTVVEQILASRLPYLCLVTPSGGHAGSAGAILLQACHVSGGVSATNVGAATPILGNGNSLTKDLRNKVINDTVSWTQSLAALRGRNPNFAKEIVTEAKAVSTEEAVKSKAMDFAVADEAEFLKRAADKKVQIQNNKDQSVKVGPVEEFPTDTRFRVLNFIADPELAYLLFMISLGLLYFELTHPGFIAPGVIGGLGLVLSLVAFNKLDVRWGGLALIMMGIGFLIAEAFVPSFGALGIGGLIALVVGSLFLYDPTVTGYSLPLSLILGVSVVLGAFFLGLGFIALKTHRRKKQDWDTEVHHRVVKVLRLEDARSGQVEIQGEIWKIESQEDLAPGDQVQILSRHGLVLKVKKHL